MAEIAVVVPAFNAESTLAATLESVRLQSKENFEVIVVDDGSADGTASIAARFATEDGRFKLIRQANRGVSAARNAGIWNTTAPFVAPLDADDIWHPTYLEKLHSALVDAPSTVFAYANTRMIDMNGRVIGDAPFSQISGDVYERLMLRNFIGNGSAMMFRRDALQVGGYVELGGSEDWLLGLRLAAHGRVAVVKEFLVGYRITPGSMSSDVLKVRCSRVAALLALHSHADSRATLSARRALGRAYGKCFLRQLLALQCYEAAKNLVQAARFDAAGACHLLFGPPRWRWLRERLRLARGAPAGDEFHLLDPTLQLSSTRNTDEPHWWGLDTDMSAACNTSSVLAREVHPSGTTG